jgi:hypothetical protein
MSWFRGGKRSNPPLHKAHIRNPFGRTTSIERGPNMNMTGTAALGTVARFLAIPVIVVAASAAILSPAAQAQCQPTLSNWSKIVLPGWGFLLDDEGTAQSPLFLSINSPNTTGEFTGTISPFGARSPVYDISGTMEQGVNAPTLSISFQYSDASNSVYKYSGAVTVNSPVTTGLCNPFIAGTFSHTFWLIIDNKLTPLLALPIGFSGSLSPNQVFN